MPFRRAISSSPTTLGTRTASNRLHRLTAAPPHPTPFIRQVSWWRHLGRYCSPGLAADADRRLWCADYSARATPVAEWSSVAHRNRDTRSVRTVMQKTAWPKTRQVLDFDPFVIAMQLRQLLPALSTVAVVQRCFPADLKVSILAYFNL